MDTFDRRSKIIKHLQKSERASTRALSTLFNVSKVTIRHDLNELEKRGWVSRVHGGAEIVPRLQHEQSFAMRQQMHLKETNRIARAAADTVLPVDTILLDSSTTVFQLALQLRESTDLRVITNNLRVVNALSVNPNIEVVIAGGIVRGKTASVVGTSAETMLAEWHADKGFFGAAGLVRERGVTDADMREVQVKRTMIKAVDEVNVLLDASKFGQQSFLTFAALPNIDHVFTDNQISDAYVDLCQEFSIQLNVA